MKYSDPLDASRESKVDTMIANADRLLDGRRLEHSQTIAASEAKVAGLENELELYEALEQDWRARRVRDELAAAVTQHQETVDMANLALLAAVEHHVRSFSAAGVAVEASFNAAIAAIKAGK